MSSQDMNPEENAYWEGRVEEKELQKVCIDKLKTALRAVQWEVDNLVVDMGEGSLDVVARRIGRIKDITSVGLEVSDDTRRD